MDRKIILIAGICLLLALSGCAQQKARKLTPTPTPTATTKPATPAKTPVKAIELFKTANSCSMCHDGLRDAKGHDVSIVSDWRETMMAHSAVDPFWQAKVSSEVERNPELSSVIQAKCAACHMPMAYTQAKVNGEKELILGEGFLNPNNPLHALAMNGVSCTLCHQIEGKNLGNESSFSGGYIIDLTTPKPNRLIYGPFVPQRPFMMINDVGYKPVYSKHITESALCAVCHTLYTPYVNSSGKVAGMFPEQMPFLELLHSSVNESCQDCHMPQTSNVRISSMPRNPAMLRPRSIFFEHRFLGGNVPMLTLMELNTGAKRDLSMLKRAVKLSIVSDTVSDGKIKVVVKVENLAGHKFPTGFPSRRAWIHFKVVDSSEKTIFDSGKCINGKIAFADDKAYEPHHDIITNQTQVQIYESVMEDTEGHVTYTLLRGAKYIKDNRLLPRGFDKSTAPACIAVYGKARNDSNFVGGSDEVTYIVNATGKAPYRVYVSMMYQPVSYHFLQDLKKDNTMLERKFLQSFERVNETVCIASVNCTVG